MPIPHENTHDKQLSAKDRVMETLSGWILDGVLEPGERIYDEELSSYFSVSRTPVREALQMLAEKGLVEILPARYTRVTPIDPEDLKKIYPLVAHLHGLAMRFAFPCVGAAELSHLEELNEVLAEALENDRVQDSLLADQKFHDLMLELADNHYLSDFIARLSLHIRRAELAYFKQKNEHFHTLFGHAKILDALRAHDLEAAVKATEENWMIACDIIVGELEAQVSETIK